MVPTPTSTSRPLRVAILGASGDLGRLLVPVLGEDPSVESVLLLDAAVPRLEMGSRAEFRRLVLTDPGASAQLVELLNEREVDVLYHLAFLDRPMRDPALAHELEVIGTMQVLTAISRTGVKRLVAPSMTACYGARPDAPAVQPESAPLRGSPARFIHDRVEVERLFADFAREHPEVAVLVLRFAPIVGPTVDNPITRWLSNRVVPTLLGFDPPWQVVHESDAARALFLALRAEATGAFNVVGDGVIALSALVRSAGAAALPMPAPLARAVMRLLHATGVASVPLPLLDYLHYGWVADGRRAEEQLGFVARHPAVEAVASMKGGGL
jgi:UDP-glucose 4-epimerase